MRLIVGKYRLTQESFHQEIEMPAGAKLLCVKNVGRQAEPALYAEIDTESTMGEKRTLVIVATGESLPAQYRTYIGTFTTNHGQFVWHVFEVR